MQQGGVSRRPGTALAVDPVAFGGIDRACAEFLDVIARIRALAVLIGEQVHWGLGEADARLVSGTTLVSRLRAKAGDGTDSVDAVLAAHARIVEDLWRAHRLALDHFVRLDAQWAGRLDAPTFALTEPAARP